MKKFIILASASLMALAGCSGGEDAGNTSSPAAPVAAPAGGDWTATTAKTPEGGMQIGNPQAAVKIVEYGALSCSHCADFAKVSHEPLMGYVKKGTVSYEFRTYLLNALDVPASLLARCNGPAPFFPISDQLFAAQADWMGKTQSLPKDAQEQLAKMTPNQAAAWLAQNLGLIDFVGQFGVSKEKAQACLADPRGVAELEAIVKAATDQYQISGTPTFIVNGNKVQANTWETLEPELKKAGA